MNSISSSYGRKKNLPDRLIIELTPENRRVLRQILQPSAHLIAPDLALEQKPKKRKYKKDPQNPHNIEPLYVPPSRELWEEMYASLVNGDFGVGSQLKRYFKFWDDPRTPVFFNLSTNRLFDKNQRFLFFTLSVFEVLVANHHAVRVGLSKKEWFIRGRIADKGRLRLRFLGGELTSCWGFALGEMEKDAEVWPHAVKVVDWLREQGV